MTWIHLEVLTVERTVLSSDVHTIVLPTVEGEISVLPGHVPLVSMLKPGALIARSDDEEHYLAVSGGFVQVTPAFVTVLADACEHAEEIDVLRAEEAKARAKRLLEERGPEVDVATAEAALRRAIARLSVAERQRRRRRHVPHRPSF
ncbi:MAG TPA: F0F1 ATP synthase subunit epsilon [Dehalococcoidia bacterium]|nr:F0F1 ATP synthase subunit epsilon [Dehalococcoidia bacterium]